MAYQKQVWRDFDDTKTELQNINNGAVATPERLNHIENGIANSADKAEVTAQLQQMAKSVSNFNDLKTAVNDGANLIYVQEGEYVFTEILRLKSNTHLLGKGDVVFKGDGSINALLVNDGTNVGGYDDNHNITIENITFDGENRPTNINVTLVGIGHATNVIVVNCKFKNLTSWHMVEFNGVKDGFIEKCLFENYSGTEAIQLDIMNDYGAFPWDGFIFDKTPCTNIFIENNTFKNITKDSKAIGNHLFVDGVYPSNIFVKNNAFENVDVCFSLHDCKNVIVEGNTAENCGWFLDISNQKNTIEDLTIKNNQFVGRFKAGTKGSGRFVGINKSPVTPAKKVYIYGNSIKNVERHAIALTVDELSISDNIIDTCGANGIYIYGGNLIKILSNIVTKSNQDGESPNASIRIENVMSGIIAKNISVIGNSIVDIEAILLPSSSYFEMGNITERGSLLQTPVKFEKYTQKPQYVDNLQYNTALTEVTETSPLSPNQMAWDSNDRALHIYNGLNNRAFIEFRTGILKSGTILEIEAEVLNVSGKKANLGLDYNPHKNNFDIEATNVKSVSSVSLEYYEKINLIYRANGDGYFRATCGLFSNQVGEIYIKNFRISVY